MDWVTSILLYGLVAPLAVLLVFGVLIFVHELGHYAAGRFGVGVEGFYRLRPRPVFPHRSPWHLMGLSPVPAGWICKFAGDATRHPSQINQKWRTGERDALSALALWRRSIVVAAGPLANFVLAFILINVLILWCGA